MSLEHQNKVKRTFFQLALVLCFLPKFVVSQQLLATDWEKTVCSNLSLIDELYSLTTDDSGYVYTLGGFASSANCLGDQLNESTGSYFLTKQKGDGSKVYSKNLGGRRHFDFGEVRICKNGDIILGLSFLDTCFINGNTVAVNNNYGNAALVKLNHNFQIQWYEVYRSNNAAYVNALELDSAGNIYVSVFSHDSLYSTSFTSKGSATILKYDPAGSLQWWRNYHTGGSALIIDDICIGKGGFRDPCIYLKGKETTGNKVYFGNQLVAQNFNGLYDQVFVSCIEPSGNHFQTQFLGKSFISIANLYQYGNKMYLAGKFQDTVVCNNAIIKPDSTASLYIATIDKNISLTQFVELKANQNLEPKVFIISDSLGYIVSGWYKNMMAVQSKTLTTTNPWYYYSFISNFDSNFLLKDLKYIEGGSCRILQLVAVGKTIYGSSEFDDLCTYSNHTNYAFNEDVSTFRTRDLGAVDWLNYTSIKSISEGQELFVYPNPSDDKIQIQTSKFSQGNYNLTIFNSLGQIIYSKSKIEPKENIDIGFLTNGVYYLQLEDQESQKIFKLLKQ